MENTCSDSGRAAPGVQIVPSRTRLGSALAGISRRVAERFFLDRHVEFWLRDLGRIESFREIRARVVDIRRETPDTRTFVLEPNRRWTQHRAGQWTRIEVEIDGVRTRRCYSLSSAPGDAQLALTVKRVSDGRVSTWLHDRLRIGDSVVLGAPSGEFVFMQPAAGRARVLFLSGGSGITPLMSMLRDFDKRPLELDVVLLHYARSRGDIIFREPIEALAKRHSWLKVIWCVDNEREGRLFDVADLEELVPDFSERDTYLCGPPGLMERAEDIWSERGLISRLRTERFSAPRRAEAADGARVELRLERSNRAIDVDTRGTLLEQLEAAGERPHHGCRVGQCRSCTVIKRRGRVASVLNGQTSEAPDEPIRLCISRPCSDLELAL